MAAIFKKDDFPSHLFNIPQLDFSEDLFGDPLQGPMVKLATHTLNVVRNPQEVEELRDSQSFLLPPDGFAKIYHTLYSIGDVIDDMGRSGGSVSQKGEGKKYRYTPFHRVEFFPLESPVGEPLVFFNPAQSQFKLFINPDLQFFFELEEKSQGVWWDPQKGVDAILQRVIDDIEVVEIRVDYLLKYLQARQMSLIIGFYKHLHFFGPNQDIIDSYVKEDVICGSPEFNAKAILQNWGLVQDTLLGDKNFLQRRLHLWFEVKPPEIDIDNPWNPPPPFDIYGFTLPTSSGPVAPGRFLSRFLKTEGTTFEGVSCEFMRSVFFRQEVLMKYQGSSGFYIDDNGSVYCRHYWALSRSTRRLGNELIATAIGDFAEAVPLDEWPHWKQFAVQTPSIESIRQLLSEQSIAQAVNSLAESLGYLNRAFIAMVTSLRIRVDHQLWSGSIDSDAAHQLKWVYPSNADDDEFLKRATLVSILVIEALVPASLRKLLNSIGPDLHLNNLRQATPLGSRNLLQRLILVAALIESMQPVISSLPLLVRQAEGQLKNTDLNLHGELLAVGEQIEKECAPLAFIYDLRNFGGLAHSPDKAKAAIAASKIGLPKSQWHRNDFMKLVNTVSESIQKMANHLGNAAEVMRH